MFVDLNKDSQEGGSPVDQSSSVQHVTDKQITDLDQRIQHLKSPHTPKHVSLDKDTQQGWQMVLEFFLSFFIMGGAGYALDVFFHTKPILMLLFFVLGFVVGLYRLIKQSHHMYDTDK